MAMTERFAFQDARRVLEGTPVVLNALLRPLRSELLHVNEGEGTWSPFQVLCHLASGETDDWVPRVRRILKNGTSEPFEPFDRVAGFTTYAGWAVPRLLDEIADLRSASLAQLDGLALRDEQLLLEGRHPAFGPVTLEHLLATWVTHDFAHLVQINRVLARHYGQFVGPWREYFSFLR
jgi:hypothetical protein